jgi:anaerobic selenocysteine-containing dehydrogenase
MAINPRNGYSDPRGVLTLALSLTHVLIENGWYDDGFVRRWTNAPLLVRTDTGRLLRASEIADDGDPSRFVGWDGVRGTPVTYDPARGRYAVAEEQLATLGTHEIATTSGPVTCRTAFDLVVQQCRAMEPTVAEKITTVPAADVERAARTLWESRPARVLHLVRPRAAQRPRCWRRLARPAAPPAAPRQGTADAHDR